ncbi:hypothetical protein [Microtetraspora malaysiensis]|uniref:Uncharacterized protein n=1 Tax=Microtetraspora malaysiensis TaxID=161358 RepID=A0ABW6T5I4_9ACTN
MLCETLNEDPIKTAGQQAPGVIELVDAADAELVGGERGDIVSFSRPGWDDAVLEYFWIDRPLARLPFLKWLAEAPLKGQREVMESITQADRELLAKRIGEFALRWAVRHRRPDPLRSLAEAWYESKAEKLWPVLIHLITSAALRDASSSYIHSMLLDWSKSKTPSLQKAVIDICASEFGLSHTGKALRRLKNAGESTEPRVVDALRLAVKTLWKDPSVRKTLFGYVVAWCARESSNILAGQRAFAVLARTMSSESPEIPVLLDMSARDDFSPTVQDLAAGWRALLDAEHGTMEATEVDEVVGLWLSAALREIAVRSVALGALRHAVDSAGPSGSQRRRDILRAAIIKWYQDTQGNFDETRTAVYTEISELIDQDLRTAIERRMITGSRPSDEAFS